MRNPSMTHIEQLRKIAFDVREEGWTPDLLEQVEGFEVRVQTKEGFPWAAVLKGSRIDEDGVLWAHVQNDKGELEEVMADRVMVIV